MENALVFYFREKVRKETVNDTLTNYDSVSNISESSNSTYLQQSYIHSLFGYFAPESLTRLYATLLKHV